MDAMMQSLQAKLDETLAHLHGLPLAELVQAAQSDSLAGLFATKVLRERLMHVEASV